MAFDYGCFISYPHDDGLLVERFMDDFTSALKAHLLNLSKDRKYWLDSEQLGVGKRHPSKIARGMCRSACWILIYYPKYRRSDFCKREYRAMRELEALRSQALGRQLPAEHSMIVPVLFRGDKDDLPGGLADSVIFGDFSKYTVSGPRILEHPESEQKIIEIADHVWNVWRTYEDLDDQMRHCEQYELPAAAGDDWGLETGGPNQDYPR
jgi:TIR domain